MPVRTYVAKAVPIMLTILAIILSRNSFKIHLLFLKNHPFTLNLCKFTSTLYLLSTLSNIYYLEYARKGPLQHIKLSWTRETFDCGFEFT